VAAGCTIKQVDLMSEWYIHESTEGPDHARIYYSTLWDGQGTPDFSTSDWIDLNFSGISGSQNLQFTPNRQSFYLAYWGNNAGSASWHLNIQKDKLNAQVVQEPLKLNFIRRGIVKASHEFDFSVQKDMANCLVGADAEAFAICINFKTLLTQQNSQFAQFLSDIGSPVLRMMTTGRYSEYGEAASRACAAVAGWGVAFPQGTDWWFDMNDFHQFCRTNGIKLIGMLSTTAVWDPQTQQAVEVCNTPANFSYGVQAAVDKITAIKNNGYSDLYVAWELGNESYYSKWWPNRFADYLNQLIPAVKAVDPNIRLSVDVQEGKETFCRDYLTRLGTNLSDVYYVNLHLYGASQTYEHSGRATKRGISGALSVLEGVPNSSHLRSIVTEWRHDWSADKLHRRFVSSVLWKSKFTMDMLAEPTLDYTGVHELFTWGGVGYWSDGNVWLRQFDNNWQEYVNSTGQPALQVGPYGHVMKRFNDALRECPKLLDHYSEISDELFYDRDAGDMEWMLLTNASQTKLIGLAVNTYRDTNILQLKDGYLGSATITSAEAITCLPENENTAEIPGGTPFLNIAPCPFTAEEITVPPRSFIYFEAELGNH
jgi:hypothetical protein